MTRSMAYRDPDLPTIDRVNDLLSRLSLPEKASLMFHTMVAVSADPEAEDTVFGLPTLSRLLLRRGLTHFNVLGDVPEARTLAEWHNQVQRAAASTRLGIPITISTDPRHSFTDNLATSALAGPFSQWPEPIGLAAIRDERLVEQFGDTMRREYRAVGIRVALHPQIDVATEPRWARINGTFGEDPDLVSRLGAAWIRGLRGPSFGPESVSAMAKHFPGGGSQADGEDPHFDYGKDQVYPAGRFEDHLRPFRAALAAGVRQIMPYYSKPVGLVRDGVPVEEVGFGLNQDIITRLLREELGFDGIVCTDWGLLTDLVFLGEPHPAKAWGAEHLSRPERALLALAAGVDQFGGEACPRVLVDLVESGQVPEGRLDVSVRRLLREKFELGLFDNPYVDPDQAEEVVGNPEARERGLAAQRASITVLRRTPDGPARLPLRRGISVYAEGIAPEVLASHARPASSPSAADVILLRINAPYEPRDGLFASFFHAGSLEFDGARLAELLELCGTAPTIIDVHLDRPAVLTPLVNAAAGLVASYGACDAALLDVLFGVARPLGRLPFDLPSTAEAVRNSPSDLAFATADPLFRYGHGLPESVVWAPG